MNAADIIARKRDGAALDDAEIRWFIGGFTRGTIPDYQMAALAMAIFLRDMSADETATLTDAMLGSGQILAWPGGPPRVDKHSTGGIGDKVSLILAPLLACCGVCVPMISGRGLGPTGGTLDKLESIPGFRCDLSLSEIQDIVERVGCVISGATDQIAPADRRLYALRDVTGTVPSIPLITASIMSKKLAEGLDALVLDVKYGSGAFMKTRERAAALAESLERTGRRMGVASAALLTPMDQPLGRTVGNALEVDEALSALSGEGPDDLLQVTLDLGSRALTLVGVADDDGAARRLLAEALRSGRARERFCDMVRAQGGDPDAPRPAYAAQPFAADRGGQLSQIDAEQIGYALIELNGGRRVQGDSIDFAVGFLMQVRLGDTVQAGQTLLNIHAPADHPGQPAARARLRRAFSIV
jgi:pyrimidine-nucleoside phosphorylase